MLVKDCEATSSRTYPNDTLAVLFQKHSIRRFVPKAVDREALELVLEAGLRAPSAGGQQPTVLWVTSDAGLNLRFGRLSKSLSNETFGPVSSAQPSILDDPSIEDAFYGAPVVVHCFTPRGSVFAPYDAAMAAANMQTAAWSLGVGSCFISRAKELFEVGWARDEARKAGIADDLEGAFHLVLGYAKDDSWSPKPLREDRLIWDGQ